MLRPTARQRIGSALLKACCATPLLLALPAVSGKTQTVIVVVAVLSAVAAALIDVLAQRDIWLRVSPTGISTRSGSIPWWAVDAIHVNDHSTVETVVVTAFETLEVTLPAPRNGPTGSNPHFPDEARLIIGNWQRYSKVRPADPLNLRSTLERAKALAEPEVIDLRPAHQLSREASTPAEVSEPPGSLDSPAKPVNEESSPTSTGSNGRAIHE